MATKNSILLILLALTLVACSTGGAPASTPTSIEPTPTEMPRAVITEGILEPEHNADLSFTDPGTVTKIPFQEGTAVKEGDVLIELNTADARAAALAGQQLALIQAQAALDDLKEFAPINPPQAIVNRHDIKDDIDTAQKLVDVLDNRRSSDERLQEAEDDLQDAQDAYERAKEIYEDIPYKSFSNLDRVLYYRIYRMRKDQRDYLSKVWQYIRAVPDRFEASSKRANLDILEAEYQKNEADLANYEDGLDPQLLSAAEARLKAAQSGVKGAEAALAGAQLRAPFDATVVRVYPQVGESIIPGNPAVIVADLSSWVIKTNELSEIDVVKVKVGQKVRITFDAIPDSTLSGTVKSIDAIASENYGDITYTTTVSLDSYIPALRWGMTAELWFEE